MVALIVECTIGYDNIGGRSLGLFSFLLLRPDHY